MRFSAIVAQQQNPTQAQVREQVREQVRKSMEDAQAQLKAAQQELRAAQAQGGRVEQTPPVPPVAPIPPIEGVEPVTVTTQTGEYIQIDPHGNVRVTDIPPRAQELGMMFLATMAVMVIGFPIARAIGRLMDRRWSAPAVKSSSSLEPQLQRIEQAVEAMAIEIERISESQRYHTRLQAGREEEALVPRRTVE